MKTLDEMKFARFEREISELKSENDRLRSKLKVSYGLMAEIIEGTTKTFRGYLKYSDIISLNERASELRSIKIEDL